MFAVLPEQLLAVEASHSAQEIMAAVCMGREEELKQLEVVKTMAVVEVEPPKHSVARVQLDYNYSKELSM